MAWSMRQSVFQAFVNELFRNLLHHCIIALILGKLIYSKSKEVHIDQVCMVLSRLLHKLYLKAWVLDCCGSFEKIAHWQAQASVKRFTSHSSVPLIFCTNNLCSISSHKQFLITHKRSELHKQLLLVKVFHQMTKNLKLKLSTQKLQIHCTIQDPTTNQSSYLPPPAPHKLPPLPILLWFTPQASPHHPQHRKFCPWTPTAYIHGSPAYVVHALLDSTCSEGHLQYLVDWEGYGPRKDPG